MLTRREAILTFSGGLVLVVCAAVKIWPLLTHSIQLGVAHIQQEGMRPYEVRELICLSQYRSSDIQGAKEALLSYLHLLGEEESSGLPFRKTAWGKSVTAARLSIICRQLGETNLARHYLEEATGYARKNAQEERNPDWVGKTDEQLGTALVDIVDALDKKNTHPKWRIN